MGRRHREGRDYSDAELVQGCSEGKAAFQERLYRRYFSFAMSIAIRYTRDETEAMEIVNDSYMKVLDSLGGYDATRSFKPWYGRIVVNTAIDAYRKNLKLKGALSTDEYPDLEGSEPEIESDLTVTDILSLLNQLPANYKVVFNLYEIEGYTHEEIAVMTGVTTSTSRSTLTRAKKMIRHLYKVNFNPANRSHEAV
jgi:RNA polymerase sigma factor (sigma-70 family)